MKSDAAAKVEQLAEQHGQAVFTTAYRILGNASDADDVFQEVFLRLLAGGSGPAADGTVRNWQSYLKVAASRSAIDLLRRRVKHRQKHEPQHAADEQATDDYRAGSRQQTADAVREALATLPPRDAHVMTLRYFEEMSYKQIAEATGLSVNQLGVILHRGRRHLHDVLKPQFAAPTQET